MHITRHIGIVGGSAPGTASCYQTIAVEAAARMGPGQRGPEVSLHARPFDEYTSLIRTGQWEAIAELMLSSAHKLAAMGAQFLIAPCNVLHHRFELVEPRSPLPWLHIAREVARAAATRGFRRIALLGTAVMMESPVYPDELGRLGIACRVPDAEERVTIDRLVAEMVQGEFREEARAYFVALIAKLAADGCDAVGLCCTELPILLGTSEAPLPVLDSTRILALAALRRALAPDAA